MFLPRGFATVIEVRPHTPNHPAELAIHRSDREERSNDNSEPGTAG